MYKTILYTLFQAWTRSCVGRAFCPWKHPSGFAMQVFFFCLVFPATFSTAISLFLYSFLFSLQARAMRCGCSRLARNLSKKREANSSSTSRPSLDSVTVISCWVRRVCSSSDSRSSALDVPTARMHACGGLITALKPLMPNIPRLDMLRERKSEGGRERRARDGMERERRQ